jgi:hypothetical protein
LLWSFVILIRFAGACACSRCGFSLWCDVDDGAGADSSECHRYRSSQIPSATYSICTRPNIYSYSALVRCVGCLPLTSTQLRRPRRPAIAPASARTRTHPHSPTPPTRPRHLGKQRARRTHVHDIMADHTSYRIHSLRPRPRLRLRSIRASRETWLMQGTESGRVIVAGLPKSTGRGFVDVGMCLVPLLYEYEYVIHSVHCTRIVSWRGGDRGPGRWQVH